MLDIIIIFHILDQNIDPKITFSKENPKIFNKLIIIKENINHKLNKNPFLKVNNIYYSNKKIIINIKINIKMLILMPE